MTITASLKRRSPTVGVRVSNTGVIQTTTPVTIQTSTSVNRLDTLQDVNASNEVNGATLIYNSNTDTYEVRKLTTNDITVDLDGGTF